jgi:apolipoprotein N-acyltransferase
VTVDAQESHASHGTPPNTLRSAFDEIPIRSAAEPRNEVIVGRRWLVTATIVRLAHLVEELHGWRRRGLSLTCGVAATAALPPLHLLPLLVPAFTALIWLCNGSRNNKAPSAVS